jgi:hypothetical protein
MAETLAGNAEVTATLQSAADQALILIQNSGESAVIVPETGGTVVFTNTLGVSATLEIPPNALADAATVSFLVVEDLPTSGLGFTIVPDLEFSIPVTLTLEYMDEDILGMDELALKLYNYDWTSKSWTDANPCGGYVRLPEENILKAIICHFSDYALVDWVDWIYLPIITK